MDLFEGSVCLVMMEFQHALDSIVKIWTPNWRERAKKLPEIEDFYSIYSNPENIIGEGHEINTFDRLGSDDQFVMKLPRYSSEKPFRWGIIRDLTPSDHNEMVNQAFYRMLGRREGMDHEYSGDKGLPQILEELGFPIVSEMVVKPLDVGEPNATVGHFIQPKMNPLTDIIGDEDGNDEENLLLEVLLAHAIGDQENPDNWMRDQKGNMRFIDMGMDFKEPYEGDRDWYANKVMDHVIDFPVSRILDEMDKNNVYEENYREFLHDMEDYTTDPKYLEIKGRRKYLEGY